MESPLRRKRSAIPSFKKPWASGSAETGEARRNQYRASDPPLVLLDVLDEHHSAKIVNYGSMRRYSSLALVK